MSTPSSTHEPPTSAESAGSEGARRPVMVLRPTDHLRIGVPSSGPTWRSAWDRRRLTVATAGAPLGALLFLDAPTTASVDTAGERIGLALLGLLSALIWATFVPRRDGVRSAPATPCGAMTGLYPVLALMALSGQPASVLPMILATAFLAWGLAQRLTGVSACPSP